MCPLRRWPETDQGTLTFVSESYSERRTHIIISKDPVAGAKARDKEISCALRAGRTIVTHDGTRVWRERTPIYGADFREIFHDDGERVRCQWAEITLDPSGNRVTRNLRQVWVGYDAAMG